MNAADKKAIETQNQRADLRTNQEDRDLQELLHHPTFRRWLVGLMEGRCGWHSGVYSGPAAGNLQMSLPRRPAQRRRRAGGSRAQRVDRGAWCDMWAEAFQALKREPHAGVVAGGGPRPARLSGHARKPRPQPPPVPPPPPRRHRPAR